MKRVSGYSHPFRLLLILEWILLGIAVLTIFSPLRIPVHFHGVSLHKALPPFFFLFKGMALGIVMCLGILGLRLPPPSRFLQIAYIALGFGLSWVVVLLGGRSMAIFPALLLVVVIRACLLFPWGGRILTAGFAYGSFLLLQIMVLLEIRPFGIPLGRSLPRVVQRLPAEVVRGVVLSVTFNTAILFALILIFVLLLVSTFVSEYRNRQALAEANQKLRDYALVVENQATLQERNRIAREIHDSVGHALAAQSIQLENVAVTLSNQNVISANQYLQKARQLGREALQHVRQSVASLRTDPLNHQTLPQAIATLVQDFRRTHTINVDAKLESGISVSDDQKIALYRITQEALTNIVKHSDAQQVQLYLKKRDFAVSLSIQDDGKGFVLESNTTGFGLQSMRERTVALSGTLQINTHPGKGCHILINVPLQQTLSKSSTGNTNPLQFS